jgi:hypothetical protein
VELFADDLKCLIQRLAGVMIGPGPDCLVDHALLLSLELNGHDSNLAQLHPTADAFPGEN